MSGQVDYFCLCMHTCTSLSFLNPAILPFRCKVTQFYGYTREGDQQGVLYDDDWQDHTYFISTQETGFELSMLKKFDVELLIGQMSYKQKATIYNITNGYDDTKKERGTRDCEDIDLECKQRESVSEAFR